MTKTEQFEQNRQEVLQHLLIWIGDKYEECKDYKRDTAMELYRFAKIAVNAYMKEKNI